MAVDGYTPLPLLPCIDNAELETSFKSLNALKDAARQGFYDVSCNPVALSIAGRTRGASDEVCEVISFPRQDAVDVKCIYLLTAIWSYSINGTSTAAATIEIKCGGKVIGQSRARPNVITPIIIAPECDVNEPFEVCVNIEQTLQPSVDTSIFDAQISWSYRLCGARLCIRNLDRSPACWVPCEFDQNCCYGSDALALIIETLNALCESFSFGGDSIRIVEIPAWNIDTPTPVALNLTGNTTFVAFGQLTICYQNLGEGDAYTVKPVVGCPSNQAECLRVSVGAGTPATYAFNQTGCKTIPAIACGECRPGEDIYIGANADLVCDVDDPEQTPPNVSVTGSWCVWLYEETTFDIAPLQQITECLDTEQVQDIIDKADAIHEAACSRGTVGCFVETIPLTGQTTDDDVVIAEPKPWQPPPNNPSQPPPEKKWFLAGAVRICFPLPVTFELESERWFGLKYEIKCGGAVVYSSPVMCPWRFTGSGMLNNCSPYVSIAANVKCDITLPLSICVTSQALAQQNALGALTFTTEGSVTGICL